MSTVNSACPASSSSCSLTLDTQSALRGVIAARDLGLPVPHVLHAHVSPDGLSAIADTVLPLILKPILDTRERIIGSHRLQLLADLTRGSLRCPSLREDRGIGIVDLGQLVSQLGLRVLRCEFAWLVIWAARRRRGFAR